MMLASMGAASKWTVALRRGLVATACMAPGVAAAACNQILGQTDAVYVPDATLVPPSGGGGGGSPPDASTLVVQPAALSFGAVSCGASASPLGVTLTNSGSVTVEWTASLAKGSMSPFIVTPAGGMLPAGGSAQVTVTPSAIPVPAPIDLHAFGDTLSFVAPGSIASVAIDMSARGAIVSVEPAMVDFGLQPCNASSVPRTVTFTNKGTEPALVSLASTFPFVVDPATLVEVGPGAKTIDTITFSPQDAGPAGALVPLLVSLPPRQALCSTPLPGVTVTGTGINGPVQLAAGTRHTCARYSDGTVRCWGSNHYGELGNGMPTPEAGPSPPVQAQIAGTTDLAVGYRHSCAIVQTHVYCWGANGFGQLGLDHGTHGVPTPVPVPDAFTKVAAGVWATCALDVAATLQCWGDYSNGELGVDPSTIDAGDDSGITTTPTYVTLPGLAIPSALSMQLFSQCALLGGSVACWPQSDADGGILSYAPQVVPALMDAVGVATSDTHSCAVRRDGTVACWGGNSNGGLGDGTTTDSLVDPVPVQGVNDGVAVAVTTNGSSCALHADGTVSCWGFNGQGQLGNGTTVDSSTPVPVRGATGVIAIAGGEFHYCMIKNDGTVWCWGANYNGQLGDGTLNSATTPVKVQGLN
jgi:alpha-tubulin suppressor-like RCC1 family protein